MSRKGRNISLGELAEAHRLLHALPIHLVASLGNCKVQELSSKPIACTPYGVQTTVPCASTSRSPFVKGTGREKRAVLQVLGRGRHQVIAELDLLFSEGHDVEAPWRVVEPQIREALQQSCSYNAERSGGEYIH